MYKTHLLYSARHAFVATVIIAMLGMLAFLSFEPTVGRGAATGSEGEFIVTQTIGDAISFVVAPGDVSMVSSIDGLTGGAATGTTYAAVRTNAPAGYNMTLTFSSTTAMNRAGGSGYINNYTPATVTVPDYDWVDNSSGQPAEFGYTVNASSTPELDQTFQNTGSTCNSAGSQDANKCWLNPSTTAQIIINTTAATAGSTSTITFRVSVPSSPSPALTSGNYVATGTLTATTNP